MHGTQQLKVQVLPKGAAKQLNSGSQSSTTISTVLLMRKQVYGKHPYLSRLMVKIDKILARDVP